MRADSLFLLSVLKAVRVLQFVHGVTVQSNVLKLF